MPCDHGEFKGTHQNATFPPQEGVKKPITRIWGLQRTSLMQLPLVALEVEQQKTAPKSHDRTGRRGSVVFPFLGKLLFSLVIYMLNLQGV